jgi:hypothetical protein
MRLKIDRLVVFFLHLQILLVIFTNPIINKIESLVKFHPSLSVFFLGGTLELK